MPLSDMPKVLSHHTEDKPVGFFALGIAVVLEYDLFLPAAGCVFVVTLQKGSIGGEVVVHRDITEKAHRRVDPGIEQSVDPCPGRRTLPHRSVSYTMISINNWRSTAIEIQRMGKTFPKQPLHCELS